MTTLTIKLEDKAARLEQALTVVRGKPRQEVKRELQSVRMYLIILKGFSK